MKFVIHGRFCSLLTIIAALLFFGCSKRGPSNQISSTAFDSAPADIKQLWTDGMGAWKSHRYPEAATNFVSLRAKAANLSPQQSDELTKAMDEFGQEAFIAANQGDKAATQAVLALRDGGNRRSGGAR